MWTVADRLCQCCHLFHPLVGKVEIVSFIFIVNFSRLPCVEETKSYITSVVVGKDVVPRSVYPYTTSITNCRKLPSCVLSLKSFQVMISDGYCAHKIIQYLWFSHHLKLVNQDHTVSSCHMLISFLFLFSGLVYLS